MTELECTVWQDSTSIGSSAGVQVIVVDLEGTHIVREGNRKLARGRDIAEEDVSQSVATLFSGIELLKESGCIVRDPRLCDGLSGGVDHNGWFTSLDDGLDELAHSADEVERCDIYVLTSSGVQTLPELLLIA